MSLSIRYALQAAEGLTAAGEKAENIDAPELDKPKRDLELSLTETRTLASQAAGIGSRLAVRFPSRHPVVTAYVAWQDALFERLGDLMSSERREEASVSSLALEAALATFLNAVGDWFDEDTPEN